MSMKQTDRFHSKCTECGFTTADRTMAANHVCAKPAVKEEACELTADETEEIDESFRGQEPPPKTVTIPQGLFKRFYKWWNSLTPAQKEEEEKAGENPPPPPKLL